MNRPVVAITLCCAIASGVACGNSPKPPADVVAKTAVDAVTTTPPGPPAAPKTDADPKSSVEAAIKSAVDAYAGVKSDAEKYLPDQAAAMEKMLASLQPRVDRSDYTGALTTAHLVKGMITALGSNIEANRTDLAGWAPMAESIPPMLAAITSRIEELKASSTLPEGLTKDAFEHARIDLRAATRGWDDALRAAALATYGVATQKAIDVKSKLTVIMTTLKMA